MGKLRPRGLTLVPWTMVLALCCPNSLDRPKQQVEMAGHAEAAVLSALPLSFCLLIGNFWSCIWTFQIICSKSWLRNNPIFPLCPVPFFLRTFSFHSITFLLKSSWQLKETKPFWGLPSINLSFSVLCFIKNRKNNKNPISETNHPQAFWNHILNWLLLWVH